MKHFIPTRKQFKNWSMLNRLGYVTALVTIFIGLIQILIWISGIVNWLTPTPKNLSPADRLLIDQNPTKVLVSDVGVKAYDSYRKIVYFEIENHSNVTARNVKVDFYNYSNEKYPLSRGEKFEDAGNGIDIPAGESRSYLVAFLEDYEVFFNPNDPGSELLQVSTNGNPGQSFRLHKTLCGDVTPCAFSTLGRSTIVSIKYGSIFGQKYKILTQFYNTFLDGEVELPKK